jgi:hypothetical protein
MKPLKQLDAVEGAMAERIHDWFANVWLDLKIMWYIIKHREVDK